MSSSNLCVCIGLYICTHVCECTCTFVRACMSKSWINVANTILTVQLTVIFLPSLLHIESMLNFLWCVNSKPAMAFSSNSRWKHGSWQWPQYAHHQHVAMALWFCLTLASNNFSCLQNRSKNYVQPGAAPVSLLAFYHALVSAITPIHLLCLLSPLSTMSQNKFHKDKDFVHCCILLESSAGMAWTQENVCSMNELPSVTKVVIYQFWSTFNILLASQLMPNFKMMW